MNGLKNSILSTVSSLAFLGLLSEKAVAQYDSDNNAKLRAIAGIQYQTTGETSIYSQKPISLKAGLQLEGKSGNRMTMFLTASADVPVAGGLGGAWHKHYEDFDHLIVERPVNYMGEKQFGFELEGFAGGAMFGCRAKDSPVIFGPAASFNVVSVKNLDVTKLLAYPELGMKIVARKDIGETLRAEFNIKGMIQFVRQDNGYGKKNGDAAYNLQASLNLRF